MTNFDDLPEDEDFDDLTPEEVEDRLQAHLDELEDNRARDEAERMAEQQKIDEEQAERNYERFLKAQENGN